MDRSTKSTPSSLNALRLFVNTGFQVLFHSPFGVLFTFPSRYWFTIGHRLVFSLGWWSTQLPTRFLVSRGTLDPDRSLFPSHTGLLPSAAQAFHPVILLGFENPFVGPQPRSLRRAFGLGCSAFARHYLRNHVCFLFLRVLRCFSSPRFPRNAYFIRRHVPGHLPRGGSPIRTSADLRLCAPSRGFSQLVASFIGFRCQGIRPVLFLA